MNRRRGLGLIVVLTAGLAVPIGLGAVSESIASTPRHSGKFEVSGGTVTFEVGTNVSAINVHGRSTNLRGRAEIREASGSFAIERLNATLPVKTITTGMGLRDEHMRKYVFETADGQAPDLTFNAGSADCTAAPGSRTESICNVSGQLTIRGTSRPFPITLKVSKAGHAYRAAGSGTVRLSTYGISRPSQFGVTTDDEVQLRLELTAKAIDARSARSVENGR